MMKLRFTLSSRWRFPLAVVAVAVCLPCLTPGPAAAQTPGGDNRWQPWLGCWSAAAPRFVDLNAAPQQICVIPAAGTSAVDVVTMSGSTVVSRERIDANGERRPSERDGCAGWESAQWSADMRRVYLQSEYTCKEGLERSTTGLMVTAPNGDWIDIVGVSLKDRVGVRVLRHRASAPLPTLPADIASAVAGLPRASVASRVTLPVGDAEIIDASHHVNGAVIEAWLAEIRPALRLNAGRLVALANAGVDDRVIDIMVALSYPQAFSIKPSPTMMGSLESGGGGPVVFTGPLLGSFPDCGPYVAGLSLYGWDGCSPFGYGFYGPSYGFAPFDIGGYGGWYDAGGGGGIVVGPIAPPPPHGQVVNGRGYMAGDSGSSSGGASSGGSFSGPSSSGTSGGSSSSSSGGDRTAVPR